MLSIPKMRVILAVAGLCLAAAWPALADHKHGATKIQVATPWVRASIGQAPNTAAYMLISNMGTKADKLVAGATPVAKKVEIHEHVMDGNIARMREVSGIPVAAGVTAALKPGGYHVMIMGLKQPLKDGDTMPLTLTFETAGEITLEVPVMKKAPKGMTDMKMDHKGMGGHKH